MTVYELNMKILFCGNRDQNRKENYPEAVYLVCLLLLLLLLSRPAQGPTETPPESTRDLPGGYSVRGVALTTHRI
jgi:hypothetical protein